jgi:surfactin family lipopeptide synthetase A
LKADRHGPVYQVFFSYEKHDYAVNFDDHLSTVIPLTHQSERAPLAIYIREFDNARDVKVDFDYNTDFFDEQIIQSCAGRFQSLISELLRHPFQKISDLQILAEEDRHRQLYTFNDTQADMLPGKTVLDLFAEQVTRCAERTAIEYQDERISYAELDLASDQLGRCLRQGHGIGRDDLVGLMLGRSPRMLTGILGILKSGGAYVPVDPDQP